MVMVGEKVKQGGDEREEDLGGDQDKATFRERDESRKVLDRGWEPSRVI